MPGVDRIELVLTGDVAIDVAGKDEDIVVNTTVNSEAISSQTGATMAFRDTLSDDEEAAPKLRTPGRRGKQKKAGLTRNSVNKP